MLMIYIIEKLLKHTFICENFYFNVRYIEESNKKKIYSNLKEKKKVYYMTRQSILIYYFLYAVYTISQYQFILYSLIINVIIGIRKMSIHKKIHPLRY